MTEINNNNRHNYGVNKNSNIERVDISGNEQLNAKNEPCEKEIPSYIPDPGVLGRSQVKGLKTADSTRSVDEAVLLAQKQPVLLTASEDMFETLYEKFVADGIPEHEAYMAALQAEEEFMIMAQPHC